MLETEYYPFLISNGIKVDDFWSMTLSEMNRIIETYYKQEKEKLIADAIIAYRSAIMIGQAFSNKLQSFNSYFPGLIDEESGDSELKRTMLKLANKNK